MKRLILSAIVAASAAAAASAQQANDAGVGFVVGDVNGGAGKLWLNRVSAVDLAVGADSSHSNFAVYGDYLYHGWKAFPQPKQGRLAAYVGGGPRIEALAHNTEFGLRAIVGASYWLPKNPIELFVELGPLFRMAPTGGVYVVGGAGFRYYIKNWN